MTTKMVRMITISRIALLTMKVKVSTRYQMTAIGNHPGETMTMMMTLVNYSVKQEILLKIRK
jgi:hypothetical protein